MSDTPEKNELEEVVGKVLINAEDCTQAMEFWTHFEVPMPDYLKESFQRFKDNPTFANQNDLKLKVAQAIGYTEHSAFHDEMFVEIVAECKDVRYDMAFDEMLEKHLDVEEDKAAAAPAVEASTKEQPPTE